MSNTGTLDRRHAQAAPARSLTQRYEALAKGNDVRTKRARLKRDLKAGRASITDVILEPPAEAETAKVADLLLAVPKWGRVKVSKTLGQVAISHSKTVGGLSRRQRTDLVARFTENERGRLQRLQRGY